MISRCFRCLLPIFVILLATWSVAAADLGTYREFTLGASTADVIALARTTEHQLKTLHERPALLQELSWRPPYTSSRVSADRDSVAAIVFSFANDQLFRIAIGYDKSRTEGLTRDDMVTALSATYGPASARPAPMAPRTTFDNLDAPTLLARWHHGDTTMSLNQIPYGGGFGLVITSVPLEALAKKAQAAAVTLDAREAPAREAARVRARAEAERAAEEKTRTTNKGAFKP